MTTRAAVREMIAAQKDRKIPTELIPRCPKCGRPMTTNLRCDDTFVQTKDGTGPQSDTAIFSAATGGARVLYLELGVGGNTPVIIKYPFWRYTAENPKATYACINLGEAWAPQELTGQAICLDGDIAQVLDSLAAH